ncbi:hypothetical protein [Taibaiella soli]|uniref:DUF928 domain-containing protein n=1 Tax=Taibaiella soli TaxID=1649169 RepID=A0A2W2BMW1_9BACT|nr:hypothetical protein [Taibaiella soli]PZF74796.1 hypothetical protein DN068_00950 [Taibaiella soli]
MKKYLTLLLLLVAASVGYSQNILVNLDQLDGIEITPNNVFNMQVINNSGASHQVKLMGSIRYRNSRLRIGYTFYTNVQPGVNMITRDKVSRLSWDFSESALRELFLNYSKLPEGNYEYCVALSLATPGNETQPGTPSDACIYNRANDIFLINLVDPENNAKLHENYPMLSWMVNYPFASALTYRVRVAEQKQGQNPQNAIARNPAMYQDNSVMGTSIVYPVTAKPLEKWQPYVWTVDAYYKGILLGGAEVWKFIIVDDSLLQSVPKDQSYYEFASHNGDTRLYATGQLKLKYISEQANDTLKMQLFDEDKKAVNLPDSIVSVTPGENFFVINLAEKIALGHNKKYDLHIKSKDQKEYIVPFTYTNPLYLK